MPLTGRAMTCGDSCQDRRTPTIEQVHSYDIIIKARPQPQQLSLDTVTSCCYERICESSQLWSSTISNTKLSENMPVLVRGFQDRSAGTV